MSTTFTQDGFPERSVVRVCKNEAVAVRFSEKCQQRDPAAHYFVTVHMVYDETYDE